MDFILLLDGFYPQSTLLGYHDSYFEYEMHEFPLVGLKDANFLNLHQCSQGIE